jgi:hypothetical protein
VRATFSLGKLPTGIINFCLFIGGLARFMPQFSAAEPLRGDFMKLRIVRSVKGGPALNSDLFYVGSKCCQSASFSDSAHFVRISVRNKSHRNDSIYFINAGFVYYIFDLRRLRGAEPDKGGRRRLSPFLIWRVIGYGTNNGGLMRRQMFLSFASADAFFSHIPA